MKEVDLLSLAQKLADVWKKHFGLYTQYIGYLSFEQIKTLFTLKKESDQYGKFKLSDLGLEELNDIAQEYNLSVFGGIEEYESVLPILLKELNKYSFRDIDNDIWISFISYLNSKIKDI